MGKYIKSSYKIYFIALLFSIINSKSIYTNCSVCLKKLDKNYLVDAWGNKFHSKHNREGHYCDCCSRLISETLTHGGFKTKTGRYICSLCYPDLVYRKIDIEDSKYRVLEQLEKVGFKNLLYNIPVELVDDLSVLQLSNDIYHKNLKGFTVIEKKINDYDDYKIYILNNLHQIEFDAVLAHEYLHVWQNNYNIHLSEPDSEGLCNLVSQLIYDNYNNTFSTILKNNLLTNDDEIYGEGYRRMKAIKDKIGWKGLIKKILKNHSY